jgi:hypothetical protein
MKTYFKIWNKFYGRKGKFGATQDGMFMKSTRRRIFGYALMFLIIWNLTNLLAPLLSNL